MCIKKMKKIGFILLIILAISLICREISAADTKQKNHSGKIAFCQQDSEYWQIWIMDLDGSNKKQLTNSKIDKRYPNLSSDGKKICYVTNDGKLWVMESDGANNKTIPLNIGATEPKWCFKDKKIVFTSFRGIYFLDDSDIWLVSSDGSSLEKIIRRPSLQFLPDVSQDSKELLFVDVLEISSHEIFKLDIEKKDYIQLTQNYFHDSAPVFTKDASKIIYSSDEDGNYDIWIMDKFGRDKKNLTHNPAFDSSAAISQDGKTIFFLSDRTKTMQIWRMDINGKNLKQITNDNQDKQDISVYAP